jgi:four helix bundle protein
MKKDNLILEKSFEFSVRIVRLYQYLVRTFREYDLPRQLLRSGTSIGANVEEAMAASSRKDFIGKLDIAEKEARETSYWLRLLHRTQYLTESEFESVYSDCQSILRILSKILVTTKESSLRPNL